ncbi:uncharacterized protein LOC108675968 [Hyalella azteca]|uniref:Uncharacterized protein LOC108675968 n=1 Tax=Hyalella azteca TaxID=294128 RepID=A0A8B7P0H6_HYAAZ|nr:uncharacterized protein LOC108675968 [Hyalella azteca]
MPASAALHQADNIMTNVDSALRTVGYDLPSLIKSIDFKTIGLVTGAIILGLLLFDVISQWLGKSLDNDYSSYSSYGRSLAVGAAKVWDKKDEIGLLEGVRGGRSLESVTKVLDSISDAVLKWEEDSGASAQQKNASAVPQQDLKTAPRKSKILFQ